MCNDPGIGQFICNAFLVPNPADDDPYMKEQSFIAYQHLHQNSVLREFQEYFDKDAASTSTVVYDLENLSGLNVRLVEGDADERCPINLQT